MIFFHKNSICLFYFFCFSGIHNVAVVLGVILTCICGKNEGIVLQKILIIFHQFMTGFCRDLRLK